MHRVAPVRLACLLVLAWLAGAGTPSPPERLAGLPRVVLWAWERPEDLTFASRLGVGVAALDRSVTLRGAAIDVQPRRQPLRVDAATPIVSVVRIEADAAAAREADPARAADAIVRAAGRPGTRAVQIDFDATRSQRDLYRRVIHEVRARLAPTVPLSMTALASWCAGDGWLDELPVDEVVPMLFEMGPDKLAIAGRVRADAPFGEGRCAAAVGVSTREPLARMPRAARAYVFAYAPWTMETATAALREVDR
jgi:hypothetical protein